MLCFKKYLFFVDNLIFLKGIAEELTLFLNPSRFLKVQSIGM